MSYSDLRAQVQGMGLLFRSGWNSLPLAIGVVALGALGIAAVVFVPGAWRFAAAPVLALFWMQLGFFGHDAGHNQVFPRTEHNRRLGLLCMPLLLGMSFRPWVIKHNLHHAVTNVIESDPDIDHPLLAFTEDAARSRRGIARWIVRYQAYAYPVLALFATVGFRIDAWRYAVGALPAARNDKYDGERRVELGLLAVNLILWLVIPSILLGPVRWLPVFAVGQMLLGFNMAFVFAPNHKGMPMLVDSSHLTFLEQQVMTSRNVFGGRLVDFAYGGLNYQIEHHLFPTMPRRNLPACREVVRSFCQETGLAYTEESVIGACRALFTSLDEIGQLVFQPVPA
ncbi:MAG: acyl-CoA desaturase [Chloroflexota bacterium]